MLNLLKIPIVRKIQVQVLCTNKSWIDVIPVQNIRAKKSFAFEPHMRFVLNSLRQLLTCTESRAYNIYDQFPTIRSIDKLTNVGNNIEFLMNKGVTSETVTDNPFLLILTEGKCDAYISIN